MFPTERKFEICVIIIDYYDYYYYYYYNYIESWNLEDDISTCYNQS